MCVPFPKPDFDIAYFFGHARVFRDFFPPPGAISGTFEINPRQRLYMGGLGFFLGTIVEVGWLQFSGDPFGAPVNRVIGVETDTGSKRR